jgi:hypothetical protein
MLAVQLFAGRHVDFGASFGSLLRMSDEANANTECEDGPLRGIHKPSPSWDFRNLPGNYFNALQVCSHFKRQLKQARETQKQELLLYHQFIGQRVRFICPEQETLWQRHIAR